MNEDKKEDKKEEEGLLNKIWNFFSKVKNVFVPKITPIVLLNEQMFGAYCNKFDFEIDEDNGVHYTLIEKAGCNKYIVFFHGIMDSINWISKEINCYDFKGGPEGKEKYKNLFESIDYNVILVEYNSVFNKKNYDIVKQRINDDKELKDAYEKYEDLYGIDQINAISNLMADTIKKILKNKKIDQLILAAHSHGNNYGLEILKKFINDNYNKDKLVYWGCKGYLDIEKTILTAADTFLRATKNQIDFGGETNLYAKIWKIWKYEPKKGEKNLSIVDKVTILLKELPDDQLLIFFKLLFFEYYDKIVKENSNEDRFIEMYDKLDIKNYELSEEKHAMKVKDFVDMEDQYTEYLKNKPKDKIPCLLFYAKNDEFVGEAFKKISNTKSTEKIEDLAKEMDTKNKKYDAKDLVANDEITNKFNEIRNYSDKKIKEIEKKIQEKANDKSLKLDMSVSKKETDEGARSFVLNINTGNEKGALEKYKEKEKENKNTKKEETTTTTTTTTKKKYCNYKKR